MEEKELAFRLTGVKKQYRLGAISGRTLQAELQSWWAKKRGREDPNTKIGANVQTGASFWALDGIDLTVYRGERVGIIGSNGAGKSTLLKLLSRVTAPTEGTIDIWGRVSSMLEVGTGFHREMTGRENIYMNGSILGMTRREIDERLDRIIAFSEIGEFIDTPVKRYSSGMFVKLAFSVAAHLNSEIMIMDEVLAVGDMAFQKKCLDTMRQAAEQEGRTVLYVSHNMNTIRRLCDRCIVLDRGRIIYDGETERGIAVYMDHGTSENTVDMKLDSGGDPARRGETGLRMEHLTLIDKITPTYGEDEPLRMRLRVRTERPLRDVVFRLTLRTDSDTGLGTGWSERMCFSEAGTHEVFLTFPMKTLAKGVFYASIGFYRCDEVGRYIPLDHITRAFKLEVEGTPVWNTTAYGYSRLPPIRAEITE